MDSASGRRVRQSLLVATALLLPLIGLPRSSAGGGEDVTAVVAKLQARYDATESFKAAFEQEIEIQALNQRLVSSGTVYFHRPGRMRWEFMAPDRQTVVADGETLWIHQEAQRQVLKIRLERAFRTRTPVSFLIGLGKLRDDFHAELLPPGPKGEIVLDLRPRDGKADVGRLQLHLAPETYDIIGAVVTDATGGTTRWEFSDLLRNMDLGDEVFQFTVPQGVDVLVPPS
jgi:outer membrane lipoprotein carrier protein